MSSRDDRVTRLMHHISIVFCLDFVLDKKGALLSAKNRYGRHGEPTNSEVGESVLALAREHKGERVFVLNENLLLSFIDEARDEAAKKTAEAGARLDAIAERFGVALAADEAANKAERGGTLSELDALAERFAIAIAADSVHEARDVPTAAYDVATRLLEERERRNTKIAP